MLISTVTSFGASITGDELNSTVQLPIFRSLMAWHAACIDAVYNARLALFIHGITSAKRMREVQPAVLVRESSTQLLIYSLDTCVRYSTYNVMYLPISSLRKAPWRP